jgi:hypothetical protein
MRYLKLFESFTSIDDLVQDAKDICLELNDDGITTKCYYNPPYVINSNIHPEFISIGMERLVSDENDYYDVLSWGEINEVIDRLIYYFESNNWKLSSILIDGDNLINPKEWIESLRKKVHYSFTGITINFSK